MSKNFRIVLYCVLFALNLYSLTCDHYIIWSLSLIAIIVIGIIYIIQYIKKKKRSNETSNSNNQTNSSKNIATQSTNNTNNTYINFNSSDKDTTVTVTIPNHNSVVEKDENRKVNRFKNHSTESDTNNDYFDKRENEIQNISISSKKKFDIESTTKLSDIKSHNKLFYEKCYNEFNQELSNIPHTHFDTNGLKQPRYLIRDMQEIKFYNITKRTNVNNLFPLIVLDVETTGLRPAQCDIIEFSAIKYESDLKAPTSCMTTLLKSKKPLPEDVIKITHITDEMIADKPYFYQIRNSVNDYINGCNIVGHNTMFDLKFLYVNGINIDQKVKYYDTLKIAKTTLKRAKTVYKAWAGGYVLDDNDDSNFDVVDYKLDTLCEYYNIFRDNSHRSLSDCLATAKLLNELIEEKLL